MRNCYCLTNNTIKRILLLLLFVPGIPLPSFSQDKAPAGFYMNMHVGAFPADDGLLVSANMAAGHQFSQWIGLGLSLGTHAHADLVPTSFSGLALQYRMKPGKRFLLSTDLGLIAKHNKTSDGEYEYRYLKKINPYFKINAGMQLGPVFHLGVAIFALPTAQSEIWAYTLDANNEQVWTYSQTVEHWYETAGFQITLGINID